MAGGTPKASAGVARVVTAASEVKTFDRRLASKHYLGATPPVGDFLRQVVEPQGQPVAPLVWGAAALKLKDREDEPGPWPAPDRQQIPRSLSMAISPNSFMRMASLRPVKLSRWRSKVVLPLPNGPVMTVMGVRAGTVSL
jgi:hypothetical protein